MSKLPVVSGTNCIKALNKVGFTIYRQKGSHITLVRIDPACQVTVPNHKTIAKGTLRSIIRQTGLSIDQFIQLL